MSNTLSAFQFTFYILLYTDINQIFANEEPIYTDGGYMTGKTISTRNGRNISAFLGIPYAKPPIGRLRFKNPEPAERWGGTFAADTDGNQCPQIDDNGSVVGDEDCLYLNVYTPKTTPKEERDVFPVMFYIHGGDFVRGNGSSTMYGPEYFLDKDVVLVTLNYRLGVLGFLATGDQHATGNFGLKDQVLALKWVQANIVYFSGHPFQVTIVGQGAGGASANLHALSDASAGLFHRFISQSGNALCFWAFNDIYEYKKHASDLGKYLNCPTGNSKVLIECLREIDIRSLVDTNAIFNDTFYVFNTWGPAVEPPNEDSFMPIKPVERVLWTRHTAYPSIRGYTGDEGLILTAQFYSNDEIYEKIKNNFHAFLRYVTTLFMNGVFITSIDRIKLIYFNGTDPSDKETFTMGMTNFISDMVFLCSEIFDYHDQTKSLVYLYSFEYRGKFSQTSRVIGSNDNIGVDHGDDLIYMFPMKAEQFGQQQLEYSESDEQMIDIIIDLWTSFTRDGVPTSKRFPEPFFWPLHTDKMEYLQIGNNSDTSLSRHDNFNGGRFDFWNFEILGDIGDSFLNAVENAK